MSSSPGYCSPNSGCCWRSPRPLEFCADFWRIPSILYAKRPRSILRFLVESRDVETLARCIDLVGNPDSFRGRIRPADQTEEGIFLEILYRPWVPPSARPRSGVLLHASSLRNCITFCPMLGCWGLRIHRWWGEFDWGACGSTSSGPPLSPSLDVPLQLPALCKIRSPTIPPLSCPFGLAKRYDNQEKEYNN